MRAKLQEIAEQSGADPRAALINSLDFDLPEFRPYRYQVLVATYIRPEKTIGGIIRPHQTLREDRFQGKIGLILKCGPLAFSDWHEKPAPGDWVIYNPADSFEVFLGNGQDATACRLIEDVAIKASVSDPIEVY